MTVWLTMKGVEMKLDDILLEYKMPKKPKARPKKTLWFNVPQLWKHDLDMAHPNHKLYYNEEEETFYALDDKQQKCYGSWNGKKKVGVTFYQPRPRMAVISPRARISEYIIPEQNQ